MFMVRVRVEQSAFFSRRAVIHFLLSTQSACRIYAAGVFDINHRGRLRDDCMHILLAKRRGLQMVRISTHLIQFTALIDLVLAIRQWTSFMAGASTAGYVYLYSFYYFFFKTKMYGLFQTVFYFGYMVCTQQQRAGIRSSNDRISYQALFCSALGLMCGKYRLLSLITSLSKLITWFV